MWELLTWQVPYHEYGPWQVVAMVTESAKRPEVPAPEELPGTGGFSGEGDYLGLMHECWAQDPAVRPTFAAIISRLRKMLAAEASLRRDSPTKAPGRAASTGLGLGGLGGDETPFTRSRLASLTTTHATDSLVLSPMMDARLSSTVGDEGASLVSTLEGGSPPMLPPMASRRSSEGGMLNAAARQLSSIAARDSDEAEATEADEAEVAEAAAAAAAAAAATTPPGSAAPPAG